MDNILNVCNTVFSKNYSCYFCVEVQVQVVFVQHNVIDLQPVVELFCAYAADLFRIIQKRNVGM